MHQHLGLAFSLQTVEHTHGARHLPGEHGFRELEHVIARHIEHGLLDLLETEFAFGVQQRQLLNFLVRGQQIAFHTVGKELQRALAFLARGHALVLQRQPLSDPVRQRSAFHGVDLYGDAVGIECRMDDERTLALLAPLNHPETAVRVTAERAMNTRLEGGCQVPIGSYAELIDGDVWLRALVGAPDGSQMVRGERRGPAEQAEALGISLAEELLDNGARDILAAVYDGEAPR